MPLFSYGCRCLGGLENKFLIVFVVVFAICIPALWKILVIARVSFPW
jgi:hypothetical protein